MESMKKLFDNVLDCLLKEYDAKIRKQTDKELTVEFKNGNWFNLYYHKNVTSSDVENEILLSSNISFFGYPDFKGHWHMDEDIFSFIKNNVFPTLNYLQGQFECSLEEICNCLDQLLIQKKLNYSKEKKLFSFEYWINEYGKKDVLEYNGFVYSFTSFGKKINLYIQLCKFIYIEIENSKDDKNCFPWYYFVDPHKKGLKSIETLFQNLYDYLS